jgi:pimeloyl-ACP methyl ester carboxylesterase
MAATTDTVDLARSGDPTRARYPDSEGYVERDGVRIFYEVYGDGAPTFHLLPTWSLIHSRFWKAQIPYLARHFRVVTHDGRGNGRSDRPQDPAAYGPNEFADDALAVMDATGTERAITMSLSAGTLWNLFLASQHPDRIIGAVFFGAVFPVTGEWPEWTRAPLTERRERYEGAERYNVHFMREHHAEFVEWWVRESINEPHSTMPIEYGIDWGLESDGETLAHTLGPVEAIGAGSMSEVFGAGHDLLLELARGIRCPVLVLEGELDRVTPQSWAEALAAETGGTYRLLPDTGHFPGRKPVPVNLALREFAESL